MSQCIEGERPRTVFRFKALSKYGQIREANRFAELESSKKSIECLNIIFFKVQLSNRIVTGDLSYHLCLMQLYISKNVVYNICKGTKYFL